MTERQKIRIRELTHQIERRLQEAADAKFAAEKLRQQLTAAERERDEALSDRHSAEAALRVEVERSERFRGLADRVSLEAEAELQACERERDEARRQALTVNRAWQAFCEDQLDACNDWLEETQTNCAGAGLLFQEEVTTP